MIEFLNYLFSFTIIKFLFVGVCLYYGFKALIWLIGLLYLVSILLVGCLESLYNKMSFFFKKCLKTK